MRTKTVKIGDRVIGGENPILIQSMTNTKTEDVMEKFLLRKWLQN